MAKVFYKLGKILGAVLIIALVFVLVVGAVEMPIAEEGKELTTAQKWLVAVKTNIETITTSLNITTGAIVTILLATYKKVSGEDTKLTADKIDGILAVISKLAEEKERQAEKDALQNKALGAIMDTFIMSDLPVSVREPLTNARNALDGGKLPNFVQGYSLDDVSQAIADKLSKVDKSTAEVETAEKTAKDGEKQQAPILNNLV